MVKTYNDPVKQIAREKQRDFIRRNLHFRRPRDIYVVCFPGAEYEGEEALEVKEIYDPLGIPRRNITGLEVDKERAERLYRADLGIKVVNTSDNEFFRTTKGEFDVISLDYTGHQTDDVRDTLGQIASRHLFGNFGVLMTNFNGQRESRRAINGMLRRFMRGKITYQNGDVQELWKTVLDFAEDPEKYDLQEIRDGIIYDTLRIMNVGTANYSSPRILESHPYVDMVNEKVLEIADRLYNGQERENFEMLMAGGFVRTDHIERALTDPKFSTDVYQELQTKMMIHFLTHDLNFDDVAANWLARMAVFREYDGYGAKKIERYRYTSNKGSNMNMDLFFLRRRTSEWNSFDNLICLDENGKLITNPLNFSEEKFIKTLRKIIKNIEDDPDQERSVTEQIYLGSSFEPPKRKERISREDAISLLSDGVPIDEILETYRGFTKMQLAAFKAHLTMGRYKEQISQGSRK